MGTAIIVIGILALVCTFPGLRWFLVGTAALVTVLIIISVAHIMQMEADERAARRNEIAAAVAAYDRKVDEILQAACSNASPDTARDQCHAYTKAACSQYTTTSDIKGCADITVSWCPDPATRRECVEEKRKEWLARIDTKKHAQHDAWCADLERNLPDLWERSYASDGQTHYLNFIGSIPKNDCLNVAATADQLIATLAPRR
jgi:hypothetical protein